MSVPDEIVLTGKSVLFIVNNFKTLASTVSFLERREFAIFHAQTLKEAVDIIGQRKIDFALLSVNLTNAAPARVIPILTGTFKTQTIAFSEKAERSSRLVLTNLDHPHKLYSPMSGPKLMAKILQMLRNEADALVDKSNDRISIKSSKEKSEPLIQTGSERQRDDAVIINSSERGNDDIIIQKGNRGQLQQATEALPIHSKGSTHSAPQPTSSSNSHPHSQNAEAGNENSTATEHKKSPAHGKPPGARTHGSEIDLAVPKLGASGRKHFTPQAAPDQKNQLEKTPVRDGKLIAPGGRESAPNEDAKSIAPVKEAATETVEPTKAHSGQNAFPPPLAKNPKLDLNVTVNPILFLLDEGQTKTPTKKRICALTVKSNKFKGYLVMAMKEGESVPIDLVHKIRMTLAAYLKRQGEEVNPDDYGFEIDLDQMEFSTWAEEYADFLALEGGSEDEIAMAFISGEDALPVMEASAIPELCAVARKDIKPDTKLDFDVYLHLPANGKFIRYGSKGGILTQLQLDRLKNGDVTYFHILQRQKKSFQAYCGRHYIRARLSNSKDVVRLSRVFKKVAV